MNSMFVRINEMWRRFFDLPMSDEFVDLKLSELKDADKGNAQWIDQHNVDARLAQQYCCTIFWDINDPRRRPDRSKTVTSQKMCDDWADGLGAKARRPLLKGPC
jgi:hypothetical protein